MIFTNPDNSCFKDMICPICESKTISKVCSLPWFSKNKKEYTDIFKCIDCGIYFRDVSFADAKQIKSHFEIAPYTRINEESKWRELKDKYFDFLIKLILKHKQIDESSIILDIGCSFGHLLDKFSKFNATCYGVEIVDSTRDYAKNKFPNLRIFETIQEISSDQKFDIITMIDILYYLDDPLNFLITLRNLIKGNGILLVRVTNRNWILNILTLFNLRINYKYFSDAKYMFSDCSMRMLFQNTGFRILKSICGEKKRKVYSKKLLNRYATQIFYGVSPFSGFFGYNITPGLIYIVEPK